MTITERTRHDMLHALEATIGKEEAMTLAEHLPPVGWADVATKSDLAHLEARLELRFEAIDQRFEAIDQRFEAIDQRFEAIDRRFEAIDRRFDTIDRRFGELEERIDLKMGTAMADLRTELSDRFAAQTRVLYLSIFSTIATLIGLSFLGR